MTRLLAILCALFPIPIGGIATAAEQGKIRIQAVVDNSIIEIAGNDGRVMIHGSHGHSITVAEITITAHGGDAHLISFEAHELSSIWGDKPKRSISPVQE